MNHGLSDQVRAVALEKYVRPAILAGKARFSVAVRDLMQHLQADGFPERNWPQVCTAIQARKFLRANGLEIESVDGPPKKQSPTVVVRYHVASQTAKPTTGTVGWEGEAANLSEETPSARAFRLTEKMRGFLKEELTEYGGGEAFLRWIRSEDKDAA
ncbi:MAG: hypothetical protein ABSC47_03390 [Terracidiphilus sp.]|jgi:hypothetical protein